MHLKRMFRTTGVVVIASLSSAAAAQTATLTGTVVNTKTQKPLADVVVTVTGNNPQDERIAVTGALGRFHISELPPGVYTLRFNKESFQPFSRSELTVGPDLTVQADAALVPDDTDEELELMLGCGGSVDIGSSTTGTNVEEGFIRRLALNRPTGRGGAIRSFESLVELAPGVEGDAYGVSIHGASPFENTYVVDGLSTHDPVSGINALPLSVEFLEDLDVLTAGSMPKHGRATGGLIRARTRSGSNEFHGSVFGNWVPGLLGGTPTPVSGPTWTISGQNAIKHQGDFGATLGGPILKDHLWFFAGVVPSRTRVEHTRTLNVLVSSQGNVDETQPIPGTSRTFLADERGLQALGKLTYVFNPDHSVSLTAITTPTRSGGEGKLTVDPVTGGVQAVLYGRPGSALTRELENDLTTSALTYDGAFLEKRLRLHARLGWARWAASSTPVTGNGLNPITYWATRPVTYFEPLPEVLRACGAAEDEALARCPVQGYQGVSDSTSFTEAVDRYQGNVQATWVLNLAGTHLLEAGVDADRPTSTRTRSLPGAVVIREPPSSTPPPILTQTSRHSTQLLGGFVQDSWTLFNRVTLNAGLRYDTQRVYTSEGEQALALAPQLSPRVGVVVDPTAEGRMKLFAHYAKYPGQLPLSLMQRVFHDTPRYTPPWRGGPGRVYTGGSSHNSPVDPELVAPSSSELVAGAEYQLLRATRLSATYVHRRLDSVVEEVSRDDGNTWFLGNPGSGLAREFPKAERTYDAATVALSRVFTEGWLAQASYTWSRLEGNYTGPAQGDFQLLQLTQNRSGLLPYDRTHSFKLFGAKAFQLTRDLSANLGLSYRSRSGTPLNYLGAHPLYGSGQTFVLPRGSSGERTPWVHTLDSNVGLTYRLGGSKAVSLTVDLFNLFDFQAATRVDQNYTHASVLPVTSGVEPGTLTPGRVTRIDDYTGQPAPLRAEDLNRSFKKPLEYQAPRQVRLGLRYSF
jgi:hypothetical protein